MADDEITSRELERRWNEYAREYIVPEVETQIKNLLEEVEPSKRKKLTTLPVPKTLDQADLYEPRMVSIGPFYRKPEYKHLGDFEYHKHRLLKSFLCRNTDLCLVHYIQALVKSYPILSAYNYEINAQHKSRIEMLLFDGCFILELFLKWLDQDPDVLFKERRGQTMLFSDLLLVDNQIPFVAIEVLYISLITVPEPTSSTRYGSSETNLAKAVQEPTSTRDAFLNLLARFLMGEEQSHISPSPVAFPETIHNLLDLCHKFLTATTSLCQNGENHQTNSSPLWKQQLHSITLRVNQRDTNRPPRQIPCATELYKEAGIKFKKKQSPRNFLDVTFSRGILEIPFLQVDNNIKALLANLVTLEAGKTWEEQIVTSYVVLMDSLIDTEGDVELLQRSGVIRNMLSSHQDAAIFFNKLGGSLLYDTVNHHFANLFKKVQLYYESKWNRSCASLVLNYLNNFWAIISVIAGVILLCLTMLQTFYTVFPYYHPRN